MHGQQSTAFAQGDASAELNQCSSNIPTSRDLPVSPGFTDLECAKFSQNPRQNLFVPPIPPNFGSLGLYFAHFLWNEIDITQITLFHNQTINEQ
jgi:hypothetical protein